MSMASRWLTLEDSQPSAGGMRQRRFFFALLLGCAATTAGCGQSDEKIATDAVAVKVNSDEITMHQVNQVLARSPNVTPDIAARARREIVDQLIDRHLASQQALERRLDRSPDVVQAIEAARTEVLARAYLQQLLAAQAKPARDEISKYYAEHPELFAQRRLYILEEIVVASKEGIAVALHDWAAKARSMQEIADWLKSRGIQYTMNRGGGAAEQIPLEILPKLQGMKEGDIRVIGNAGGSINVIRVIATAAAPVDEATAARRIQQFLLNRRSSELVAAEIRRLKDQARIEYVGEFRGGATVAQARQLAATLAPNEALLPASDGEKGVRGLQ